MLCSQMAETLHALSVSFLNFVSFPHESILESFSASSLFLRTQGCCLYAITIKDNSRLPWATVFFASHYKLRATQGELSFVPLKVIGCAFPENLFSPFFFGFSFSEEFLC